MFDQLFKSVSAIDRHTKAPLYRERVRYLAHLLSLGSARGTLVTKADCLLHVQAELRLRSPTAMSLTRIEAAAGRWVARRGSHRTQTTNDWSRRHFISVARDWLEFLGWFQSKVAKHPYAVQIEAFRSFMRDERCLSPITIYSQICRVTEFLTLIGRVGSRLDLLNIETIDRILELKACSDGLTRVSIQRYVSNIRSFLRYAEAESWCRRGLADALPPCRAYKNESLPASPSWESVNRLVTEAGGQRPSDLRNRAILLLLVLYGLRSSEVVRLCLDDLDWEHAILTVHRTKPTQQVQVYPLIPSVAEAISDYLKRGRPVTRLRQVFLRAHAPYLPLSGKAIWHIVSRRLMTMNEPIRHHGPHALRHACATYLLASGFSMHEIGGFLGHRNLDSTGVYAKVDLTALRRVADLEIKEAL
jgi:integrase/recombinase XerD